MNLRTISKESASEIEFIYQEKGSGNELVWGRVHFRAGDQQVSCGHFDH
jgi:hypothetical protein